VTLDRELIESQRQDIHLIGKAFLDHRQGAAFIFPPPERRLALG
jgi:hypothetical protein